MHIYMLIAINCYFTFNPRMRMFDFVLDGSIIWIASIHWNLLRKVVVYACCVLTVCLLCGWCGQHTHCVWGLIVLTDNWLIYGAFPMTLVKSKAFNPTTDACHVCIQYRGQLMPVMCAYSTEANWCLSYVHTVQRPTDACHVCIQYRGQLMPVMCAYSIETNWCLSCVRTV